MLDAVPFGAIWVVDFEFHHPPGERPTPIVCVAKELRSGRIVRLTGDDLRHPPYHANDTSLLVAYYSSAEWSCHGVLGWPMPRRVLDLFCEFRCLTNGRELPAGRGLVGACVYFGVDGVDPLRKDTMRDLAMRGGPYAWHELQSLLDYCEGDVLATERLLYAMLPHVDLPRALLRGRYMVAAARMELTGTPIDTETLGALRSSWDRLKYEIVARVDRDYGVFDGSVFREEWFERWLTQQGIGWPLLPSGRIALDDDTFREMAKLYPAVAPIREARSSLAKLRLNDLAVGSDGRNRCMLSAFRARTGRNQPSNTKFIFGPSVWLRSLIQPRPGFGLTYVDYSQQEFGIAAALSGDERMMEAYASGDPYLAFAKQAGAVPADATKQSHAAVRDQFKICALGTQYGMSEATLGRRIGKTESAGRALLRAHRQTYPRFWRWVEAARDFGMLHRRLWTVFGWRLYVGPEVKPRALMNFPMQANGAEMLRLAACLATEAGVSVCCPVHDALLIEAPASELRAVVARTQVAMAEASRVVLGGLELRSDAKVIRHPERYIDPRGRAMWEAVRKSMRHQRPPQCAAGGALMRHPRPPVQSYICLLSSIYNKGGTP